MLDKAKLLFNSGYQRISNCYVSVRRFICKHIGSISLFIIKIVIEKLIEKIIEYLF